MLVRLNLKTSVLTFTDKPAGSKPAGSEPSGSRVTGLQGPTLGSISHQTTGCWSGETQHSCFYEWWWPGATPPWPWSNQNRLLKQIHQMPLGPSLTNKTINHETLVEAASVLFWLVNYRVSVVWQKTMLITPEQRARLYQALGPRLSI